MVFGVILGPWPRVPGVRTFCELTRWKEARPGCRRAHVGAADGGVQLLCELPLPQGQLLIGFRGEEKFHAADGGGIFQQTHGWIKGTRPMGTDKQCCPPPT